MYQSQAPHQLGGEVAFLRAERRASGEGDAFAAVDRVAIAVSGHERGVPGRFDVLRDLVEDEVPRDVLPRGRARGSVLGRFDPPRRNGQLHRGGALGTESSLVDGAVGVALDLKEL